MRINQDKIQKLQAGGVMTYQPLPIMPNVDTGDQSSVGTGKTEAPQGDRVLDDDTFKAMLGKGITNDVVAFQSTLDNAYAEYSNMSDIERGTARGRKLRNIIRGDLGTLTYLINAKENLANATKVVTSQDALAELAITPQGMVVKDGSTGKISQISSEEYAKDLASNNRKYIALTNAELIKEREYNQGLAGDTSSFEALNSAIGITKIKDEVYQALQTITADASKKQGNTFVDSHNQQLIAGIQEMQAMANTGVFDVTRTEMVESNKESVKRAIEATWMNLSPNARAVLKARAAARGVAADKLEEEALKYVVSLLSPKQYLKTDVTTDIKYNKDLSEAKHGKGEDGSGDPGEIGYWEGMVTRKGTPEKFIINAGSNAQIETIGARHGVMPDSTGKGYGMTALDNIKELPTNIDMASISFGDIHVDPSKMNAIVYDGGSTATYNLPYKTNPDGSVSPNFEVAEAKSKADKEISALPPQSRTAQVAQSIYNKYGVQTDGSGKVPTKLFFAFKAMANDNVVEGKKSPYLTNESKGPNEDYIKQTYERIYRRDEKGKEIDRPGYGWFSSPDIYSGMIYAPVIGDGVAARLSDGNAPYTAKSNLDVNAYREDSVNKYRDGYIGGAPPQSGNYSSTDALKALIKK